MSFANVMLAVLDRAEAGANASGSNLYAGIRAAGNATPCVIWDAQLSRVSMTQGGIWAPTVGFATSYYLIELSLTFISDSLSTCFGQLSDFQDEFDAATHTVTVNGNTYKMTIESFGPFSTETATPDDGQQDGERSLTGSISIHITEV
jgi:hypothetical protein